MGIGRGDTDEEGGLLGSIFSEALPVFLRALPITWFRLLSLMTCGWAKWCDILKAFLSKC
jgi:hypothetical protein